MNWPRYSHRMTLRLKFVLPISIMLVISMSIMSGYLINRQSEGFRRELETQGETTIKVLALNAESGVLFESPYELDHLLSILSQFESMEYCRISNLDGQILAHIGQVQIESEQLPQLHRECREGDTLATSYLADNNGKNLLVLVSPITHEKNVLNRENLGISAGVDQTVASTAVLETIGYIELGLSVEQVNTAIADAQIGAVLLSLLVVISAIFMIAFIVGAITRPITELVEATDQISRGDFSIRVELDRNDEIGHLAQTFNHMTASLEQSHKEIEQYNRTLEGKIIERTRQLEEAQVQLHQSEKMSAIGQLAAGVAHELNNPLGGILGYAQFTLEKLRKNLPEKDPPKDLLSYIRYVSDIELQARRCKTIVQNLLRFSRTSPGTELEEINVNSVIEETVTFVGHQLKMNQLELTINLAPDLPLVQGNAGQLQQVFTNLIINAMHASEPDSEITITSHYSSALGEFGGAVELIFSDTGHGIAREDIKKIFEPFFTTKEVGKGTGLGLSVSYGIIKEHGGEITVESEPGVGTAFTVVLPVQKSVPKPIQ